MASTMARWVVLAFATIFSASTSGCAQKPYLHWQGGDVFAVTEDPGRAPTQIECPGTTEQRFECFAKLLKKRAGDTSGAFGVVERDRALFRTATEPGQSFQTTWDTLFPLGSVTKMFTAATVLRLAEEGVLDLNRPIASYIPELGAESEIGRATLHQLLSHTAGVLDSPDQPLCVGPGALSGVIARAHVGAEPGAVYLYSNTGYSLVGIIIERVTQKKFEDVMRERVLSPMGLASATFDAASLQVRGHGDVPPASKRCRAMHPPGGLIMSSRDLLRWAQAMSNPETHPLGRGLVDALTAPRVLTGNRPGETYGYGVGAAVQGGVRVYNHGGNVEDFSAFIAWVPDRRFGSIAVANRAGGAPSIAVTRGLSLFLNLPDDWRPSANGQSHPLTAYLGTYVDRRSSLGRVRVRLEGEHLAFDYLDGPPALLPARFQFRFGPNDERAKFLVTAVGIGERIADER
jgi:CubicO group peptidase (beta-lactamase class C family)